MRLYSGKHCNNCYVSSNVILVASFVVDDLSCLVLHFMEFLTCEGPRMQPRCSICWTTRNLANCSKEDCPNLLCTLHGNRYDGRCRDCWETASIIVRPRRLRTRRTIAEHLGQTPKQKQST